MEHEKEESTKDDRFTPKTVYFVVVISNVIVAVLVIHLFFMAWFGKRDDSHVHFVNAIIENYASMQVKIDVLDKKVDDVKRELEEIKQKLK